MQISYTIGLQTRLRHQADQIGYWTLETMVGQLIENKRNMWIS